MARASTYTLLPLDQFAETLGMNPWIFNGYDELKILGQARSKDCQDVWWQNSWNGKFLSREELAQSIAATERNIADLIRFWPGPKYITGEVYEFPRARTTRSSSMFDLRGQWKKAPLSFMKIIQPGIQKLEFLESIPVTRDGTNLNTLFSADYTNTSGYAVDELILIFDEDETGGYPIDLTWQIRPVLRSQAAGIVTFKGPQYLLAPPSKLNLINPQKLDPSSSESYVTTVDVYRLYMDSSHTADNPAQGSAIWNIPTGGPYPSICDPDCEVFEAPLCLQNTDADSGIVAVQSDPTTWPSGFLWGITGPNKIRVNYLSGVSYENGKMASWMADIVTKLTCSMLPSENCGCDRHNAILRFWRMLPSEGAEDARPLTPEEINNPFGPRRGGIYAYRRLQGYMLDGTTIQGN